MSTLFLIASGLLFGSACVAFAGREREAPDRAAIYFIASALFAIAGALA